MTITHNVWNKFLNLLKENNIEVPRFPLHGQIGGIVMEKARE